MTPVWKEVLCLGWQIDPRTKKRYEVKSSNVKEAHRNFQKMRARGVPVPACWEHQDIEAGDAPTGAEAIAEWKRNYARYTFAHLGDSRINERGNLDMLHEVQDDEDVKRLKKVRYVSPKIYNGYFDSRGGQYDGTTVVHSAATPTPVQNWQRPWELSESDAVYLSYAPPEGAEIEEECPVYSETFTEWLDELELSFTADPDEGAPVAEEKKEPPKEEKTEGGGGKGKKSLTDVIKALKDTGMNIPDEVEDETGLVIAIKAAKGGTSVSEPGPSDADLNAAADESTTGGTGGPPMVMSTLDKDPKKRDRAVKYAKEERDDAEKKINAVFAKGNVDGPKKREWMRVVTACEMSFTDGKVTSPRFEKVMAEVAEADKLPKGSVWKPSGRTRADGSVDLSALEEVPTSGAAAGLMSTPSGIEEARAEARAISERMSTVQPPPK